MTERRPLILRADTAPPRLQELPAGDLLPADTLGNALKVLLQGLVTGNNAGITSADTVLQALGKLQAQASAKVDKDGAKVLSDNNFTNDERVKLANIQAAATKNLADAVLLERSNHTGGFNGFGVMNDMRNSSAKPFGLPPSAFFGNGTYSGLALGTEIGIPEMGYGTGRVDAQWTDSSAGYGVMRSFESNGGRRYTCYATSADTWSPWRETTHRANMYGTQPLSTISDAGTAAAMNVLGSGGIIERGSNANGEYVKLADGTGIAWGHRIGYVAGENIITMPLGFLGVCGSSLSIIPSTGWQTPNGWYANNSNFIFSMPLANAGNGYVFFAAGRWK